MNKSKILEQIRNIIKFAATTETTDESGDISFIDVKSGDNIIRTMGDDFVVGEEVFVVTEEGEIPAPDGEHTLDDGRTLITQGGLLSDIIQPQEGEVEVEEEVEEFQSELEIDEEEGIVKDEEDVTMKKMQEAEDKIVMLEKKIGDLEEVVTEMTKGYGKISKYSKEIEGKLNKLVKETPAEKFSQSYKSDYKSSLREQKTNFDQKLDGFRSIRKS